MPRRLVLILAWLQLPASLAIAATTIAAYEKVGPSLREATRSAAAAVTGVSDAMERASETIEARRLLIAQTAGVLAMAATQIGQVEALASRHAKLAPQYAENLHSASGLLITLGEASHSIAGAMDFEVPVGLTFQGMSPVISRSRPFAGRAKMLDDASKELKIVGATLSAAASSLESGAQTLDKTIAETGRHSRILIGELETTIKLVSSKELPDALDSLKRTSASLRALGSTIDEAQGLGIWFLSAGLLLSLWCILNSLSTIGLVSAASRAPVVAVRGPVS